MCSSIPFLDPVIALLLKRYRLFLHLHEKHDLPIYTLRVPGVRCYIVNDHSLIPFIDRQIRTISFAPIEAKGTAGALGTSSLTNEIMNRDPTSETGHFITYHRAVRPSLSPGPGLDAMLRRSVAALEQSMYNSRRSKSLRLFHWIRHEIIVATAEGDYGPGNPFRDSNFEDAWYTYLSGVPVMVSQFAPSLIAKKSLKAREFLAKRFEHYFLDNSHLKGSAALLARIEHGITTGLPASDRARGELGACMALHNNTVPGAFWLIFHIFSDPALHLECRGELENYVRGNAGILNLETDSITSSCPILLSTLHEVFRYRAIGTVTVRQVVEDHDLKGTYLLKQGSLVLIPNIVQHFNTAIWGPDANTFNPRRFLEPPSRKGDAFKRRSASVLRAFGGGPLLCPGRHFAIGEILAFAAMMVMRFDISPVNGRWEDLKVEESFGLGIANVFLLPRNDIEVHVTPRHDEMWAVSLPGDTDAATGARPLKGNK